MNRKELQKGSAHLIIVIVLAVALVGTLGYIFWQNFTKSETNKQSQSSQADKKTTENNDKTDSSKTEAELTEIAADTVAGTNLAIKYPKDWQMTYNILGPEETIIGKKYAITSPSGKIKVNFQVSHGGLGGMCEDVNGDEIQYINRENLSTFSNVEYLEYYISNFYFAGIHQTNGLISIAQVGDSVCNLGISGAFSPVNNNKDIENMTLLLGIEFPQIEHNSASSVEKFKEIIKTDDYKIAKNIVKSIYVKN